MLGGEVMDPRNTLQLRPRGPGKNPRAPLPDTRPPREGSESFHEQGSLETVLPLPRNTSRQRRTPSPPEPEPAKPDEPHPEMGSPYPAQFPGRQAIGVSSTAYGQIEALLGETAHTRFDRPEQERRKPGPTVLSRKATFTMHDQPGGGAGKLDRFTSTMMVLRGERLFHREQRVPGLPGSWGWPGPPR